MFRLMIIFFGLFIAFRLFLHLAVKLVNYINKDNFYESKRSNNKNRHHKNMIQDLAKCDYCGLYILKEESVHYNGKIFCCNEHAKKI